MQAVTLLMQSVKGEQHMIERLTVGETYTPVSYTHLDVYKRQEYSCIAD